MRAVLSLILAGLLVIPLAGCGRKGSPETPENTVYPRIYPYVPMPAPSSQAGSAPAPAPAAEPYQPPQPNLGVVRPKQGDSQ